MCISKDLARKIIDSTFENPRGEKVVDKNKLRKSFQEWVKPFEDQQFKTYYGFIDPFESTRTFINNTFGGDFCEVIKYIGDSNEQ